MTIIIAFIIILTACIALGLLVLKHKSPKEAKLQKRFDSIGIMHGLTKEEVIVKVGHPNSITTIGALGEILQWSQEGFDMVILRQE